MGPTLPMCKHALLPDPMRLAIRFVEPAPHAMRFAVVESIHGLAGLRARYEIPGEKYTVFSLSPDKRGPGAVGEVIDQLLDTPMVARVARVYRAGLNQVTTTDRVVAKLHPGSVAAVRRFETRGYEVLNVRDTEYLLRLPPGADPIAVARELADEKETVWADADFVEYGAVREFGLSAAPAGPEDPRDPDARLQWARPRTHADDALRQLTGGTGSPAIRIAIVDSGVDRQHPDLGGAIISFADAADDPPRQQPQPRDTHGTACAGLAAAIPGNNVGIRGFGAGCSLMDVRVMYTSEARIWKISGESVARGIDWAVCNGADVVNLSLDLRYPHLPVISAIQRALTDGRKRKGCVVVAGTGNDNREDVPGVKFPACIPGVIAVAATSMDGDEPITRELHGTNWTSAFGPEVALAAPGQAHQTTDNMGEGGLNPNDSPTGDYIDNFDGTSSSCAIVSGAAALVLSAKPELGWKEVREILTSTATPLKHPGDRVGAGLVNLEAAVKRSLGIQ